MDGQKDRQQTDGPMENTKTLCLQPPPLMGRHIMIQLRFLKSTKDLLFWVHQYNFIAKTLHFIKNIKVKFCSIKTHACWLANTCTGNCVSIKACSMTFDPYSSINQSFKPVEFFLELHFS